MKLPAVPNVGVPNAVWVWMTLLGVYAPLASEALRFFLTGDVVFSYAGATARGVDAVLNLREDSLEPISEHSLSWYVADESVGRRIGVHASFLPKGRSRSRECVDTVFTLNSEGRLTQVEQTKSYVAGEEVSDIA